MGQRSRQCWEVGSSLSFTDEQTEARAGAPAQLWLPPAGQGEATGEGWPRALATHHQSRCVMPLRAGEVP